MTGDNYHLTQKVCFNTTISASFGGLSSLLLSILVDKVESIGKMTNGLLAGLVAITASCDASNVYTSILIGSMGGSV